MVLFTLALTAAADLGANFIRRQVREDPNHPRARGGRPLAVQWARKWAGIGFALCMVVWSVWYQGREHSSAIVPEAQLPKLTGLFEPKGWQHLAIFEGLLKPELDWEAEREGALVRSHFVARTADGPKPATDPAAFAASLQGKRLVLGPANREPAHSGPRSYLEKQTGKPLEQVFAEVRTTGSDIETLLAVARGEADVGAIEWESFGPARKDPRTAEFMKRRAPVIDIAHTTDWYPALKREPGALPVSLRSALIPVGMAVIGTLLGVLAAIALCYPHSVAFQLEPQRFTGEAPGALRRGLRAVQLLLARAVALTSRAIPEVMWAMFFVAFFGAGVVAGAFALAIHTLGVLVRVFSETVDNIPYRRFEQAAGGSRAACFGYAAVPASWRDWMTYSFFQFESNVRAGVVLGIIGSAGLGFVFSVNFEHFQYPKAATNLLVIILLTVVIDRLSRLLKLSRVAT
ncbi:MAG: ABC transporter permease subunit [Planctomycetes bacterium]|nr:ABC transporter permease subunit [Planctomycetota bacterium]